MLFIHYREQKVVRSLNPSVLQSSTAKTVDASAVKEGNITGTNKDLRRLSMVESKNLLLKLGLSEDDIKGVADSQLCLRIL